MEQVKINQFKNDMLTQYGINLSTLLSGEGEKEKIFINRVEMIVLEEIKSNNPTFRLDLMGLLELDAIYKAELEQAYYLCQNNNYDMNTAIGYDPINNTVVPINEIRKRAFSPLSKKILTNAGLFYRGLGNNKVDSYAYTRGFWR
jgi:hypothetical protein